MTEKIIEIGAVYTAVITWKKISVFRSTSICENMCIDMHHVGFPGERYQLRHSMD
jgi:hypothetical protein